MTRPTLALGIVGVIGAGLLVAAGPARPAPRHLATATWDWADRVIARVARHEGRHDSLNLNLDGTGLSFGILQWAQKSGSLGVLLTQMHWADPRRFATTFGPSWRELLDVTTHGSLDPVGGALLWTDPWVGRILAAGRDPVFVEVLDRLARQGFHFHGALEAAGVLGVYTERSMSLTFDTSVQQGPAFAILLAGRVRDAFLSEGRTSVSYAELLRSYADLAAAPFRRSTVPTKPYPSKRIEWRETDGEWHAWAGHFDLYADIRRRRNGILADSDLSDAPLRVFG